MFRIGEFSTLVRVSARMLRHYEKRGLLAPAEIDRFTGYRMYSADQIPLLSRIVMFRDAGFGIDEIGALIEHSGDEAYVSAAIAAKRRQIEHDIQTERKKLHQLDTVADMLKGVNIMGTIYDVELKALPEVRALCTRAILPTYEDEHTLWHSLGGYMAQHGIPCAHGYSLYLDDEYKEKDVLVEIAVSVEKMGADDGDFIYKVLPAIPLAATVRFKGPYDQYSAASSKLAKWMEENGYAFAGHLRGQSLASPGDQTDPENFLTELQAPVVKK